MRALLLPVALFLLAVAVPGARADGCKQAGPLPQSKCTKDSQCCPGLVCQAPPGPNRNNATMQCMGGCRIGGGFQTPGQRNTAPNNCQSCQPSVSTTAWTNLGSTTVCRSSAGICDTAESCTGTSGACPANGFVSSTAVCRAAAGACDSAENCTGTSAACPGDAKSTAVCRPAAGACDVSESCNGVSNDCPADAKVSAGTVCRPVQGVCDVAESCDGSGNNCPADGVASSTVVCRQATGDCDIAESCDGSTVLCPPDAVQPNGTACDDGACESGVCETTTTTTTVASTTTTTMTGTGPFECPPEDEAGFPLGQSDTSANPIFCSYPAFPDEDPNDFFCTYDDTTGALVEDHDAGFCPGTAVPIGATTTTTPATTTTAASMTTTTVTGTTTTTMAGSPGCFRCPPEDQLGFPVADKNESTDPMFCSYPAVPGEDPNDFFCTYSFNTGALVTDNDAGLCQPTAVNICS